MVPLSSVLEWTEVVTSQNVSHDAQLNAGTISFNLHDHHDASGRNARAIMGALPIALGYGADGSSRIPLGLVVVGGLAFSQVVTLFVTPGLFLYMQAFQEKFLDRFELTRAGSSRKNES